MRNHNPRTPNFYSGVAHLRFRRIEMYEDEVGPPRIVPYVAFVSSSDREQQRRTDLIVAPNTFFYNFYFGGAGAKNENLLVAS